MEHRFVDGVIKFKLSCAHLFALYLREAHLIQLRFFLFQFFALETSSEYHLIIYYNFQYLVGGRLQLGEQGELGEEPTHFLR